MAFITRSDLQKFETKSTYGTKDANIILSEAAVNFSATHSYDIFLSHSYLDADQILKVKRLFESYKYSVYVDWVDDAQLDRTSVTTETAELLKERMKTSATLVYVTSTNSSESKWMQWELGYFDALKNKVAILPILQNRSDDFNGLEYLGLYPYIDLDKAKNTQEEVLWVNKNKDTYKKFHDWLNE